MESKRSISSARATSPPRRQRACVPCSRAKARCNFRNENIRIHLCDRCEKLGIDCSEKTTKSLRKPRQLKPLNSRVSSLEKQLQQLTTTLGDSSSRQGSGSVCSAQSDPPASPPSTTGTPSSSRHSSISTQARYSSVSASNGQTPAAPPNGLTWREAAGILDIYRQKLMFRFPCVVIDDATTPQQLLQEKPFVFRAVMLAAAPFSVSRASKMKRNVMAYLGHRLLVEEQRQFDLLQGLIVLLAWNDLDYWADNQITVLTYTALGLAHSLRLSKTPHGVLQQQGREQALDGAYQLKDNATSLGHSVEEQRALIALFCLVSLNSTYFGRRNPLDSQYITICCDSLARSSELSYDYYLERVARMYLIADKLTLAFGSPNDNERPQPYLFLVEGHARDIRAELTAIMESLDFENFAVHQRCLQQQHRQALDEQEEYNVRREYFTLHYHYLLVRLYEPATYLQDIPDGQATLYRAVCLRNCLFAAKAFLDIVVQVPPSGYLYVAATAREHVNFVISVATRLMFVDAPGWDKSFARATIDMAAVLDTLIKATLTAETQRRARVLRFAKETCRSGADTPERADSDCEVSQWITGAEKSRSLRDWFLAEIKNSAATSWTANPTMGPWDDCHAAMSMAAVGSLAESCTSVQGGTPTPTLPPVTLGLDDRPMNPSTGYPFDTMYGPASWTFEGDM